MIYVLFTLRETIIEKNYNWTIESVKEGLPDKREHKFRRAVRIQKIMRRWIDAMRDMSSRRKCWTDPSNDQIQLIKGASSTCYVIIRVVQAGKLNFERG